MELGWTKLWVAVSSRCIKSIKLTPLFIQMYYNTTVLSFSLHGLKHKTVAVVHTHMGKHRCITPTPTICKQQTN